MNSCAPLTSSIVTTHRPSVELHSPRSQSNMVARLPWRRSRIAAADGVRWTGSPSRRSPLGQRVRSSEYRVHQVATPRHQTPGSGALAGGDHWRELGRKIVDLPKVIVPVQIDRAGDAFAVCVRSIGLPNTANSFEKWLENARCVEHARWAPRSTCAQPAGPVRCIGLAAHTFSNGTPAERYTRRTASALSAS